MEQTGMEKLKLLSENFANTLRKLEHYEQLLNEISESDGRQEEVLTVQKSILLEQNELRTIADMITRLVNKL
jgi:hypothetical protein